MKTNIRLNCFETNSSSSHSITLAPKKSINHLSSLIKVPNYTGNIIPDKNGAIIITGGEFEDGGRFSDGKEFTDSYTKACYCYLEFNSHYNEQKREELIRDLIDLIKQQTGAKDVFISSEAVQDPNNLSNYLVDVHYRQGIEGIKNFIFNPESKLVINYNSN